MEVISLVNRSSLIKGKKYIAREVNVNRGIYGLHDCYIRLKGLTNDFNLNHFSDINGNPIKKESFGDYLHEKFREVEKGDFLKSISIATKTLEYGKIYPVYEIYDRETSYARVTFEDSEKGKDHAYLLSSKNFEIVDKAKVRELKLDSLIDDETPDELELNNKPFFDKYEKEAKILKLVFSAMDYLNKTQVNASLYEVIQHFVEHNSLLNIQDIKSFNYKKIINGSNS